MAGSFRLSCSGSPGAAVVLKETLESSSTHGCLPGCTRNQPASLSTRHPFSLALRRRSCARSSGHGWSSWSLARRDQSSLPWRLTKLASDYDTWTCQEAINHISNDAEMRKIQRHIYSDSQVVPVGQAFTVSTIPNSYVNSTTRIKSAIVDALLHKEWSKIIWIFHSDQLNGHSGSNLNNHADCSSGIYGESYRAFVSMHMTRYYHIHMSSIEQRLHRGHHTVTFTLMSPIAIIPRGMQQYDEPWCLLPIDLGKIRLKSREANA